MLRNAFELLSTEATLELVRLRLVDVLSDLQGKADLSETQPVSLASVPLPTGAATEASVATAVTRLTSILAAVDGLEANTTGTASETTLAAVLAAVDGLETNTTGLATQATLASILTSVDGLEAALAALGPLAVTVDEAREQQRVETQRKKFYDDFGGAALDTTKWDVITNTGSPGVTVTGSELRVAAAGGGATEYLIRSKETFLLPARISHILRATPVGAGAIIDIEMVSVDGAGAPDGLNNVGLEHNFTASSSTALISLAGSGTVQAPSNTRTVLSPNSSAFSNGVLWETWAFDDMVAFFSRDLSGSAGQMPIYYSRYDYAPQPDPTKEYKLQIRVRMNAGTNVAFVDKVIVSDFNVVDTQIIGGRGNSAGVNPNPMRTQGIPVTLLDSPIQVGVTNYTVPLYVRQSGSVGTTQTTTNLGVGATFTGSFTEALPVSALKPDVRIAVMHAGASLGTGTLVMEESNNASTWRETKRWPIPNDGVYRTIQWVPSLEYFRLRFINGPVAQTSMYLYTIAIPMASSSRSHDDTLHYQESVTALGSSATYAGITLDLGMQPQFDLQRGFVFADQAGTLNLQQSRDGTTWRTVATQAVAANESWVVEAPVSMRYCRLQYVNGGSAQGTFELFQTLVPRS